MPGLCPRCSKAVYFAEEIKTKGEVFHKLCFNCSGCKKLLEPGNFSENDGNIYCRTCYGWVSGRGLCLQLLYDFNNLAKVLDPEDMVLVAGPEFFRLRMVREEEEKRGSLWPQQVPCHQGGVKGFFLFHEWLKDEEVATDGQKKPWEEKRKRGVEGVWCCWHFHNAGSGDAKPKWGGGNICPKCQKTVYFAEQLKVEKIQGFFLL